MSDFAFTSDYRRLGNYVFSTICIALGFAISARRNRPPWLLGAMVFVALFIVLFLSAAAVEVFYGPPKTVGWGPTFSLPFLLTWMSALPIQEVFNLLLGEDNIVEEHLMLPSALLMWGGIGAALGATVAKIKRRHCAR
jgi:hypothetical protein